MIASRARRLLDRRHRAVREQERERLVVFVVDVGLAGRDRQHADDVTRREERYGEHRSNGESLVGFDHESIIEWGVRQADELTVVDDPTGHALPGDVAHRSLVLTDPRPRTAEQLHATLVEHANRRVVPR